MPGILCTANNNWWKNPNATHAFWLSLISVVVTATAAISGILAYQVTESSLMLCYGLENWVDFFSSVIVLWRFFLPGGLADESRMVSLRQREKRASIAISFILGLLGIGVIVAAAHDYDQGEEEEENLGILIGISFVSIIIFGFMTTVKFHYAIRLSSAALQKDAVCSLIGTILSGSLFFNTMIIVKYPEYWWIDPTVALVCGALSLLIGFWAVLRALCQGIPIYNPKWWFLSRGDGKDEVSGRPLERPDYATSDSFMKDGDTELPPRNEDGTIDVHEEEGEIL
mmetsp:Transcript_16958/g.23261  ORF Transcript_16958/g.23261 Transcript_16958/m.23261 type:complete len:284 (-) Transcript_16958:498-1349(-)|eukprot:CAMPEP_0185729202 /NCGR_PEP_ID=MMETSP1171-20130828/4557_1 /TAXON_ID=374046 /ORGANISM="Helicotheca tamensis, Strain CCMP826" /LENGTH=283 /DNA_ID=CAMNT_0028397985 /DNA_START=209 /DNA_END=1060 /DNA_ORIENTATION=+